MKIVKTLIFGQNSGGRDVQICGGISQFSGGGNGDATPTSENLGYFANIFTSCGIRERKY